MRRFRFAILALILLAVASPSFAICRDCSPEGFCVSNPQSGTRCRQSVDHCTITGNCLMPGSEEQTVVSTLVVASVEIKQPTGTRIQQADAAKPAVVAELPAKK